MNTNELTYLFGKIDTLFKTFLILIVIDYISGICKAIYNKKLSSDIGAKGIIKKIGYLLTIIVAELIGNLYNSLDIRNILLYMFIANEVISILENISQIGIVIPDFIKNKLIKGGDNNEQNKWFNIS